MPVSIKPYSDKLSSAFKQEKHRIKNSIGDISIHHVGSSAVGIGGKNIIDILIGVKNKSEMDLVRDQYKSEMDLVRDQLLKLNYFEGNDTHQERIFIASKQQETGEGDFHIHICPISSDSYKDFLILKQYLISNKDKAEEYLLKKELFAKEANYNRQKYKQLKSAYVTKLLIEAKKN